ncbi:hypothetical protein H4Q26_011206 [Puccinia striiformis f. sp. tritici PST-130]|nr:hypothetical protein H4Q26_011206 [Puccinia striiformis f. sp. tritici PST-130]
MRESSWIEPSRFHGIVVATLCFCFSLAGRVAHSFSVLSASGNIFHLKEESDASKFSASCKDHSGACVATLCSARLTSVAEDFTTPPRLLAGARAK